MLDGLSIDVVGLDTLESAEVEETGATFEENAVLKASGYAAALNLPAIADDSGLEIDALGGRPGVYSARYGGEQLSFAEKMKLVLAEMEASGSGDRTARFRSVIAISDARGEIVTISNGVCEGMIAQNPRGKGGFGYDPIFIPDGFDQTFGELPDEIKAEISHRARSFHEIIPFLRDFMAKST